VKIKNIFDTFLRLFFYYKKEKREKRCKPKNLVMRGFVLVGIVGNVDKIFSIKNWRKSSCEQLWHS